MPLAQPRGVILCGEGCQGLPEFLDGGEVANPRKLLLEGSYGPLGHAVAFWLAYEEGELVMPKKRTSFWKAFAM